MRIKRGLIIGDSIGWTLNGTATGSSGDNTTPYSTQHWSHRLVQALDPLYPNSKLKWVNRSFGGQTSSGAYSRFAACIQFPFDFLILSLGTNDAANNAVPPATTQANLVGMANRARYERGQSLPIVMCTPPNTGDATRTPYIAATRGAVVAAAGAFDNGVALAELENAWAAVDNATYLNSDLIHPNSAGMAVISPLIQAALVSVAGTLMSGG